MRKVAIVAFIRAYVKMRLFRDTELKIDPWLFFPALILISIGTTMVYSSSAIFALEKTGRASFFLTRHLSSLLVGATAYLIVSHIAPEVFKRLVFPILIVSFLSLIALYIPGIGTKIDGATRWFRLGPLSVQPTEFCKLSLIIYLAYSLSKKRDQVRIFTVGFMPHLVVSGLMAALIVKQPDLGSAAVLMSVTLIMLFVAGTRLSYLLLAILVAVPIAYQQIVGSPWRLKRLLAYLDPWGYRFGAGYQISESLISVGAGGLWGKGIGTGKQKLFYLPAAHNDFIFATTAEELGLIGVSFVIMLYIMIIYRGVKISFRASSLFRSYLALGLVVMIAVQTLLHMSVVFGMVPTKGIPLPFFSYGGSGLIVNMVSIAMLQQVAHAPMASAAVPAATRRNRQTIKHQVAAARG